MVNISKQKLKPHTEKAIIEELLRHIGRLKGKDAREFLTEFITDAERIQLAKRFAIVLLLLRQYSFGQIEKMLKVSSATVVKQWQQLKGGKYVRLRTSDFFHGHQLSDETAVEELLTMLAKGFPPRAGKGRWEFMKHW